MEENSDPCKANRMCGLRIWCYLWAIRKDLVELAKHDGSACFAGFLSSNKGDKISGFVELRPSLAEGLAAGRVVNWWLVGHC
jgi:hypothetical protein